MPEILPLTTAEVADRLSLTRQSVLFLISAGVLIPIYKLPKINGTYLFDPKDVETLAEERAKRKAARAERKARTVARRAKKAGEVSK